MNDQFKIGEVVIFQNLTLFGDLNGTETTIITGLTTREVFNLLENRWETVEVYMVDVTGFPRFVEPRFLRKKQPPQTFRGELRVMQMFTPQQVTA